MTLEVQFRVDLPHGRCVGVRVPLLDDEPMLACLHPQERSYVQGLAPARRASWLAGRVALHEALMDLNMDVPAILPNDRGAPDLGSEAVGSISHKQTLAIALAAPARSGHKVGVDIEPVPALPSAVGEPSWDRRLDISHRVMTRPELDALDALPDDQRRRTVLLCFSIKESLYKALNPLIHRYVSFQEATVMPAMDGKVEVTLQLIQNEGPFWVEARWSEIAGHFLTTARIRSVSSAPVK